MNYLYAYLGIILVGILVASLLSGMEAGVFALSRLRIRHLMRKGNHRAGMLYKYLDNTEEFLWTILVGNTLANFAVVVTAVLLLHGELAQNPWLFVLAMAAGSFFYYILTDLFPKMLFRQFPNRLCLFLVQPFKLLHISLRPFVATVSWLATRMLRLSGGKTFRGMIFGNREELKDFIHENAKALSTEERSMISRVLELQNRTVGQIVIPFARSVTISADATISSAMALGKEKQLTKIPVWAGKEAEIRILGVLSLKSVHYAEPPDPERRVREFVKPAIFLSVDTRLEEALRRLQRGGQRLAIVLGHDRKEVGIICLQDILRFIFGEVNL